MPLSLGKLALAIVLVAPWTVAAADDPTRALAELPGFDFSRLPAPSKRELLNVFTDEFDYCGRPLTLLASLKKGDACRHTKRLATLAALQAADGTPASEIILALSKYNQSFHGKRNAFKLDERMCMGAKDAKVTLVEFSDFECPYCAIARPLLEDFVKPKADAAGKAPAREGVRLCFMPFPLSGHAHAMTAGQAVLFARDAGRFWQLHDLLFDNQLSLSEASIKDLVKKVGLDPAQLQKAIDTKRYVEELNASKEAGRLAGVDSTPSVYVNGRKLALGLAVETLTLTIDDELDWAQGNNGWPTN